MVSTKLRMYTIQVVGLTHENDPAGVDVLIPDEILELHGLAMRIQDRVQGEFKTLLDVAISKLN